ncbi:hypothetical protein E6Q11_06905 [Candidatus Dojkabacteria bacterium]|uniref:Uncharacterized protein n=1 Tax=Candidatus Dojkabacteria bacterium TaxID=2099670 RepID=A0A5C7J2L5_9BACT|nr:MAG: hypothetical protein E6Q11_06905 [Candidatus Dojkabacteria bacterium]
MTYAEYSRKVRGYTSRVLAMGYDLLDAPGIRGNNDDMNHTNVDHIVPIRQCYAMNVTIELAGGMCNLQSLPANENKKKGSSWLGVGSEQIRAHCTYSDATRNVLTKCDTIQHTFDELTLYYEMNGKYIIPVPTNCDIDLKRIKQICDNHKLQYEFV